MLRTIAFLIFLFILNIVFVTQPFLFKIIYPNLTQSDQFGWRREEQTRQAEYITQHLNSVNSFEKNSLLSNSISLTDKEISHMNDVSKVLFELKIVSLILFVILSLSCVFYYRQKKITTQSVKTFLKKSLILYTVSAGTLALLMFVAWNFFFTTMHEVLFPGGNWSFPVNSTLIRLFPEIFWQRITLFIILLPALEMIVAYSLLRARKLQTPR